MSFDEISITIRRITGARCHRDDSCPGERPNCMTELIARTPWRTAAPTMPPGSAKGATAPSRAEQLKGNQFRLKRRTTRLLKGGDDGIGLGSLVHYDLGYIDLEQRTLQSIDNPFGTRLSPMP